MNIKQSKFLDALMERFQGDFDNHYQVIHDRNVLHREPGPGGGHEHMHATLMPLVHVHRVQDVRGVFENEKKNENDIRGLIAGYYLNGDPSQLFRLRLYILQAEKQLPNMDTPIIRMKLFAPHPAVIEKLKPILHQPLEWEDTLLSLKSKLENKKTALFTELVGCDVFWTLHPDESRHLYLYDGHDQEEEAKHAFCSNCSGVRLPQDIPKAFQAKMINANGTLMNSTMIPNKQVLIKDELSLWEDELWINDRGFDVIRVGEEKSGIKVGGFLYGNQRGIPYKVRRVTDFCPTRSVPGTVSEGEEAVTGNPIPMHERRVVDWDLVWTLGQEWHQEEDYHDCLSIV